MRVWLFTGIAVTLDGLAGLAGGLLSESWLKRHLMAVVGFAAGALLGAVFLDVLPEAVRSSPHALGWTLGGFVSLALFEWSTGHHHAHDGPGPMVRPFALLGSDALHNTGDGAAIAAAFLASVPAGVAVSLAVVVHELPQEIGDYAILRSAGYSKAKALVALSLVQLTAAIGAVALLVGSRLSTHLTGPVLGIAAGTFLYIAGTDLLPDVQSAEGSERLERMVGFIAGIFLIGAGRYFLR